MSRRSRPPRNRKSRNPDPILQVVAPRVDGPLTIVPAAESIRETEPPPAIDELAALDAGWDEVV